jgi:hypothetical protein
MLRSYDRIMGALSGAPRRFRRIRTHCWDPEVHTRAPREISRRQQHYGHEVTDFRTKQHDMRANCWGGDNNTTIALRANMRNILMSSFHWWILHCSIFSINWKGLYELNKPSASETPVRNSVFTGGKDPASYDNVKKEIDKTIPVTGCGGLLGCETSRLPAFSLDNRLTDGGKVDSHPLPQKDSWYSCLLEAESTPEPYCGWKE